MTKSARAAAAMFNVKLAVSCHPALNGHWRDVQALENTYEFPADVETVRRLLDAGKVNAFVAEHDGTVAGWCVWKFEGRALRIVRMVVLPEFRRMRVGTQMIWEVKSKLTRKRPTAKARVREYNDDAVRFLSSKECGFSGTGVAPGSWEDEEVDDWAFEFRMPFE